MSSLEYFATLTDRIKRKDFPKESELLPYLSLPSVQHRQEVNFVLANAYAEAGDLDKARGLALRAVKIGPFHYQAFQLTIDILRHMKEYETAVTIARNAVVQTGQLRDEEAFYRALMLYYRICGQLNELPEIIPEPYVDPAIEMALEHCFPKTDRPLFDQHNASRRRLRIGYFLWGEANIQNALVRNVMSLVSNHDYDKFDVGVYAYGTRAELLRDEPKFQQLIDEIEECGAYFRDGVNVQNGPARLRATRDKIVDDKLDVLVFSGQLFNHKLLAHFGCAPIQVGINQGNPRAYTSPQLDTSFVYTTHGQMEAVCESHYFDRAISPAAIARRAPQSKAVTSEDLSIPTGKMIIFTSGRDYKFNSSGYWALVQSILKQRKDVYWVCAGVSDADVSEFGIELDPQIKTRLRLLGWRNDVSIGLLPLADLVVDTFPAGGGFSLYEGMLLNKPCISFDSNYFREFANREWSPAFEPFSDYNLSVPFNDVAEMENRILKLIDDPDARDSVGRTCKEAVEQMIDCSRLAREVEGLYTALVAPQLNNRISASF